MWPPPGFSWLIGVSMGTLLPVPSLSHPQMACLSVLLTLVWMSFQFRMKTRGRPWLVPHMAAGRCFHGIQSSSISQVGQERGVDE